MKVLTICGTLAAMATIAFAQINMVSDALEQIVPAAVRGRKVSDRILRFSGNSIETIEYENILLSESRNGLEPQGNTITFKQSACSVLAQ
jgi:hypothetical protein